MDDRKETGSAPCTVELDGREAAALKAIAGIYGTDLKGAAGIVIRCGLKEMEPQHEELADLKEVKSIIGKLERSGAFAPGILTTGEEYASDGCGELAGKVTMPREAW